MASKEKTYQVFAPNSGFTGIRAGVTFGDGKGQATKAQALQLKDRGYRVPALEDEDDAGSLQSIDGIGQVMAKRLAEAGVATPEQLAGANAEELAEEADISQEKIEGWQEAAKAAQEDA